MKGVPLVLDEQGNQIFNTKSKRIRFIKSGLVAVSGRAIPLSFIKEEGIRGRAYGEISTGYIGLNFNELVGLQRSNSVIKKRVLETLAHEVRHLFQFGGEGKISGFLNEISTWPYSLEIFIGTLCLGVITTFLARNIENLWVLIICGVISFICGVTALLIFAGFVFYEFIDPKEKEARAFAKEALKDEEWLKIVKVENRDAP